MISEVVQLAVNLPEQSSIVHSVLRSIVKLLEELSVPVNKVLKAGLESNCIQDHCNLRTPLPCGKCAIPRHTKSKAKALLETNVQRQSLYNWPENAQFTLFSFLVKSEDFVHFCIPSGRLKVNKHITVNSKTVYLKKPKHGKILEVNYHGHLTLGA